jgi:hypothetical protein
MQLASIPGAAVLNFSTETRLLRPIENRLTGWLACFNSRKGD